VLNGEGRSIVPEAATMGSPNQDLTFETDGHFTMGRREKLSVAGRLIIEAVDGIVTVGDLSALDIDVTAASMTVLGREEAAVRLKDGNFVTDRGTEIAGNSVRLNTPTASWDGEFRRPSVVTPNGEVDAGTLNGIDRRLLNETGQNLKAADFRDPALLDIAGTGVFANPATEIPPSEIDGAVISPQMELLDPPVVQSQPVYAARTTDSDVLDFLRCRGGGGAGECAAPKTGRNFDDGVLDSRVALRAADIHEAVFGQAPSTRDRRDDLRAAAEASRQAGQIDGLHMARRLASAEHAGASDYLKQLGALLDQITLLNLTRESADSVRDAVLAEALEQLEIEGMTVYQLEASTGRRSAGMRL